MCAMRRGGAPQKTNIPSANVTAQSNFLEKKVSMPA